MVNAQMPTGATPQGVRFFLGLAIVVFGYATALIGCVAFFKIPLVLTIGMMFAGLAAIFLPSWIDGRLAFAQTSRAHSATYVIGLLMILALEVAFANSNWMTWYLHPAGYQSTWLFLVAAFFHCRSILRHFPPENRSAEVPIAGYDENQIDNPYSPPMRSQPDTKQSS